ncbi:hypothetical protein Sango_1732700 [Sesamum angolense]|uniref:Transmembrane Fragile-X-F-associated protein n=1 Tax=Sesamum angolense TaxID=2727404 RepID=A0AAE1WLY4_9LAMI|nr:hypothetical protein Sango_1732700 [Sesamum angolense]
MAPAEPGISASSDDWTIVMIIEWAPCHAVVAMPLLVAFELLLCIYLESIYSTGLAAVNLKIVFLPLLAFEAIILIDNFRMCKALLPGDDESMTDDAIWETLPHFWVAISMVFFLAATVFTLLKLCGDVGALGWWDLFINYGIAECFAFLVCTKWSNPVIHRNSRTREESSSSTAIRYLDWNSGLVVSSEDHSQDRMCGLQDIGGHIMKIPVLGFQILLCMRLEGTPVGARHIPLPVLFSPIFLLQGAGVLFAASRLIEKIVLLLRSEASEGIYFVYSSRIRDCFDFLHHGSRLLGWWSIDETSREEQARLFHDGASGYNTFSGYPPEIVKKMPKKDLAEEAPVQMLSNHGIKCGKKYFPPYTMKQAWPKDLIVEGIAFYAASALINVRNARFVECLLKSGYLKPKISSVASSPWSAAAAAAAAAASPLILANRYYSSQRVGF